MVAKEISTLVAESLDDILQCVYKNANTGARSIVYIVVEQILFDLLRRGVIFETLDMHIFTCVKSSNADDKVCENLFSDNSFTAPIPNFIQLKTDEQIAAERVATKMEQQLTMDTWDSAGKRVASELVSLPSRTVSAPSLSLVD